MYLWIPTSCLNAFWHAVPTSFHIFNVFITLFVCFLYKHIFLCTCEKVDIQFVKESVELYQGSLQWTITTSRMFANWQKVGGNDSKLTRERSDNNV